MSLEKVYRYKCNVGENRSIWSADPLHITHEPRIETRNPAGCSEVSEVNVSSRWMMSHTCNTKST
jgi:hypothetical protein